MKRPSISFRVLARGINRLKQFGLSLLLLVLITGCGQLDTTPAPTPQATTAATTSAGSSSPTTAAAAPTASGTVASQAEATPTEAEATPSIAAGKDTFTNPVLQTDFADPQVIEVGTTFYAYATNAGGRNIQVTQSTDMVDWGLVSEAMPALPSWAVLGGSYVWAPSVIQIGDKFVMYYTARDKASDKQCIGVATSDKPEGKYLDKNDHPFVCVPDEGGDIDPAPLSDGGKLYLYWKNDGNCCGIPTYLYAQELSPDGLSLVGKPARLIQNDQFWEGRVIEGPQMFKHGTTYYLFFSGGNYADVTYAVGYAACEGPVGPCTEAPEPENPILHSKMDKEPLVIGPGGESVIQVGDQTWMYYHVWNEESGSRGSSRYMWLDKVEWDGGKPVVKGPTTGPQPDPQIAK